MRGTRVITSLATRFPQLYVAPAEDAQQAHRLASLRGYVAPDATLDHFHTTDADELRVVETPAGPIEVLFLRDRHDFETFLQIIGHHSQPDPIARTVGAITYRGLPDWGAIADARERYLNEGGTDWPSEFARLAKKPGAFRIELIVISEGPYSNLPATRTPYGEQEWMRVSREIRLHHECAHVVCRRTMPDDIAPVWDELTADVTGLICATGHYDADLAARFLGVCADGYGEGRLVEYLDDAQRADVDRIATEVYQAMVRVQELSQDVRVSEAFDFLLQLKREPLLAY